MRPETEDKLISYLAQCWRWRIPRTCTDLKPDISYYLHISGVENTFENGQPSE